MDVESNLQFSDSQRVVADFLLTFLRMLDSNLPAPRASTEKISMHRVGRLARWPPLSS